MNYNFKSKVLAAKVKISELQLDLAHANRVLTELLKNCPHEWKSSPKGYEHEGRFCLICGISELAIKR